MSVDKRSKTSIVYVNPKVERSTRSHPFVEVGRHEKETIAKTVVNLPHTAPIFPATKDSLVVCLIDRGKVQQFHFFDRAGTFRARRVGGARLTAHGCEAG